MSLTMSLAKYEGDRGERPAATGDAAADELAHLKADLADPACFELIITGPSGSHKWRRVNGTD